MGFYWRKSAKIGPFRINFSQSGVGVSAGIKGLRVGKGPRGNYIHMTGPMGIQYRQSLNGGTRQSAAPKQSGLPGQDISAENVQWVDSGDVDAMRDVTFDNILNEINMKYARPHAWIMGFAIAPIIAICFFSILSSNNVSGAGGIAWISLPILLLSLIVVWKAVDTNRRTTYIFYNLDDIQEQKTQSLYQALDELRACAGKWYVVGTKTLDVRESRSNAGADSAIQLNFTTIEYKAPKYIVSNVIPVQIPVGRQTLYFYPDRLLVEEKKKVGTVNYADLKIISEESPMLIVGVVPPDATVIQKVWQHAKKNGDPDARYKDNVQFPVCAYSGISLTSESGLNEAIRLSKRGVGGSLAAAALTFSPARP